MKLRKLIILAVAPMMCLAANAQDNTPKKGDFTVAATVGANSYTSLKAVSGAGTENVGLESNTINFADQKLMLGIEGGWFFHDLWKVTLGGGMNISSNPGYDAVEGATDAGLPGYNYVLNQSTVQFQVYTGVDRYFDNLFQVKNLLPYAGVRLGYAYGRNTAQGDASWYGKSIGESFNIRGALTVGVDYFVNETFFMGIQVDPFAYTYNRCTLKPQEGLRNLEADSNNFSFIAAPTLKVGFKF
ncbi:MAG: hypothetical protein IJZ42_01085 [Lachnospiraceae bacterium]|nr:hypothetical protein [Lachnospiraceae bacterium]